MISPNIHLLKTPPPLILIALLWAHKDVKERKYQISDSAFSTMTNAHIRYDHKTHNFAITKPTEKIV